MADLNSLLKSKLNISDAPVMMAGAAAPAPAAAAPVEVFVVIDGLVVVMFYVEVCCVCYYVMIMIDGHGECAGCDGRAGHHGWGCDQTYISYLTSPKLLCTGTFE